ncbi:MAG: phosphotransferase [Thermodesulfobacteriota bacterium]
MDIPSLRKALLDLSLYRDESTEVEFIETHISLVFLTKAYAYKVKKPVDFGFLDFTSLDKRKYFCEQEVKLNRRLSSDMYLGVVAITLDRDRVSFNGNGRVEEYAVQMKRIPEEWLLDKLLAKGQVDRAMIGALSERLARFYASAETNERIKSFAKPERVRQDTDENFDQTRKYVGGVISRAVYEEIQKRTNKFFRTREALFHRRIASERIRDCHGDLRLEHIFWGKEILIFDCIEFNDRFRYTDVAADIGFLAMDLDYHGREDLSEHLVRRYIETSGDPEVLEMLDFYKCYRAYVRGKVESFRLDDPHIPELEKKGAWTRAKKYFELAHQYALRF